jgi:hypothetical protein
MKKNAPTHAMTDHVDIALSPRCSEISPTADDGGVTGVSAWNPDVGMCNSISQTVSDVQYYAACVLYGLR